MAIALDLFCGAGGAAMGMHRTGLFDRIVGVDIMPQPDYPFQFYQGDALEADLSKFKPDFIWASPPCQPFVSLAAMPTGRCSTVPNLIPATRDLISEHPWTCIENVRNSPIRGDIRLEGGNVGIPNMHRHRKFEVSWETLSPTPYTDGNVYHKIYGSGGTRDRKTVERRVANGMPKRVTVAEVQALWDVYWTDDWFALTQMVPPAYATYIVNDAVNKGFGK